VLRAFLKVEILAFAAFVMLVTTLASDAQVLPAGSYLQSCANVSVQGGVSLSATCRDRSGKFKPTRIEYISECVGGIFNDDGALKCSRGALPPPGSYTQTCERQYVGNGHLMAVCRNRDGNFVRTTLLYTGCIGDIYNDNGNLWCRRTAAQVPSGSYSQSCQQTSVAGDALVSLCRERGGLLRRTSLAKFQQCVGDIFNDNGILGCRR